MKPKFQYRCYSRCGVFAHIDTNYNFENFFKTKKVPLKTIKINEIRRKLNYDSVAEDLEVIKFFNFPHKESCLNNNDEASNSHTTDLIKTNQKYLEDLIRAHPLQTPKFFKTEAIKNDHFFKLTDINDTLTKIRKQIFPSEPEIILS